MTIPSWLEFKEKLSKDNKTGMPTPTTIKELEENIKDLKDDWKSEFDAVVGEFGRFEELITAIENKNKGSAVSKLKNMKRYSKRISNFHKKVSSDLDDLKSHLILFYPELVPDISDIQFKMQIYDDFFILYFSRYSGLLDTKAIEGIINPNKGNKSSSFNIEKIQGIKTKFENWVALLNELSELLSKMSNLGKYFREKFASKFIPVQKNLAFYYLRDNASLIEKSIKGVLDSVTGEFKKSLSIEYTIKNHISEHEKVLVVNFNLKVRPKGFNEKEVSYMKDSERSNILKDYQFSINIQSNTEGTGFRTMLHFPDSDNRQLKGYQVENSLEELQPKLEYFINYDTRSLLVSYSAFKFGYYLIKATQRTKQKAEKIVAKFSSLPIIVYNKAYDKDINNKDLPRRVYTHTTRSENNKWIIGMVEEDRYSRIGDPQITELYLRMTIEGSNLMIYEINVGGRLFSEHEVLDKKQRDIITAKKQALINRYNHKIVRNSTIFEDLLVDYYKLIETVLKIKKALHEQRVQIAA